MDNACLKIILIDECDFALFYELAGYAEIVLQIVFNKVDDIDSLFYSYQYKAADFVLSYHVYSGVELTLVSKDGDSEQLEEMAALLRRFIQK